MMAFWEPRHGDMHNWFSKIGWTDYCGLFDYLQNIFCSALIYMWDIHGTANIYMNYVLFNRIRAGFAYAFICNQTFRTGMAKSSIFIRNKTIRTAFTWIVKIHYFIWLAFWAVVSLTIGKGSLLTSFTLTIGIDNILYIGTRFAFSPVRTKRVIQWFFSTFWQIEYNKTESGMLKKCMSLMIPWVLCFWKHEANR